MGLILNTSSKLTITTEGIEDTVIRGTSLSRMGGRLLLAGVHRQQAGEKEMAEAVLELSIIL